MGGSQKHNSSPSLNNCSTATLSRYLTTQHHMFVYLKKPCLKNETFFIFIETLPFNLIYLTNPFPEGRYVCRHQGSPEKKTTDLLNSPETRISCLLHTYIKVASFLLQEKKLIQLTRQSEILTGEDVSCLFNITH